MRRPYAVHADVIDHDGREVEAGEEYRHSLISAGDTKQEAIANYRRHIRALDWDVEIVSDPVAEEVTEQELFAALQGTLPDSFGENAEFGTERWQ